MMGFFFRVGLLPPLCGSALPPFISPEPNFWKCIIWFGNEPSRDDVPLSHKKTFDRKKKEENNWPVISVLGAEAGGMLRHWSESWSHRSIFFRVNNLRRCSLSERKWKKMGKHQSRRPRWKSCRAFRVFAANWRHWRRRTGRQTVSARRSFLFSTNKKTLTKKYKQIMMTVLFHYGRYERQFTHFAAICVLEVQKRARQCGNSFVSTEVFAVAESNPSGTTGAGAPPCTDPADE